MPDPYVNLFPNYASLQQLGTDSYDAYLRTYLKQIPLPYLSWDNYSLEHGRMDPRFYDNLEQVRRVTLEAGIPFWNCVLANTLFRYMEPSDATFHLQVYATLAYGGRGIQFFTYFTPDIGNFRPASIDMHGNKTATWDMLRRITHEVHALAPALGSSAALASITGPFPPPPARRLWRTCTRAAASWLENSRTPADVRG